MKCKNCGNEIEENSFLCSVCGTQVPEVKEGNIVGFVLGLVSIGAWILPFIGLPVTLVGLAFSILNIRSNKKTVNIIGTVLCSIFLVVTILNSILGVMLAIGKY